MFSNVLDRKGQAHCVLSKALEIDELKKKIDRDSNLKKSKFKAVFDALNVNPISLKGTRDL